MAELKKLQENGVDIYPVTLEDVVFDSNGNTLPNKYQTKEDSTLNTTDKTIVGAINELFQSGTNVKQNLVDALVAKGVNCSTSDSFDTLINGVTSIKTTVNMPTWIKNKWIQSSDIKTATINAGTVGYGDYIYIIGGQTGGSYDNIVSTVLRFNTKTGDFTTMASIPHTCSPKHSTVIINNIIYVMYSDDIYCYNISSNSWSTIADTPRYFSSFSACAINKIIYLTGGYQSNAPLGENFSYNITTNTVTTLTNMPTASINFPSVTVNNKIYCIGGEVESYYTKANQCYDPSTNTWSSKTDMPSDKYDHVAEVINNKIYVITGGNINSSCQTTNYCYDPSTDTWTTKSAIPQGKHLAGSAVSNGWIYVVGGYAPNGAIFYKTNYCYIP